jgi:MFS transporter, DHA1 family, inner membrane transport protein
MMGVGAMSVIGLVEPMAHDLGVSRGAVALLVTVYALIYAIAAPALQTVVGHWDRRHLIVLGLGTMAIGSLMCAIASSFAVVAAARMLMAIGGALVGPMSSAAGAGLVPAERQGAALGIVFSGMTIATVLGVPLCAFLGAIVGWRVVMALVAGLSVAVMILVLIALPSGSRGIRTTQGALLTVISDKVLAPAISVTFFQMAAQFATYSLIGAYLITIFNVDISLVPVALVIFGIGGVVGNTMAARLIGTFGVEQLILASLVMLGLIFGAFLVAPVSVVIAFSLLALWSIAALLMMAPQQARLVTIAPGAGNLVLALNASALYLGMAVGSALAGLIFDRLGAAALPLASLALTALGLLAFLVSRRPNV